MATQAARLGNQFFRYAFARALQLKLYPDYRLILNIACFRNSARQKNNNGFENALQYFRVKHSGYSEKRLRYQMSFVHLCAAGFRDVFLARILPDETLKRFDARILQPFYNKVLGLYNPVNVSGYMKPIKSRSLNIFCNADFQHFAYFNDIRDLLLEEFTPIAEPLPENLALLGRIQSSESVCVHIRRGDYLSSVNASVFHVCNEEYFVTAMKAIREEIPDCKFFVFSDDVEEVKKNFHLPFDAEYVASSIPPYETLRLMYSCKHFIISNSTFSWWGQYLSRNPHKIVYAPTPWLWRDGKRKGMYLPYMRTIECHKH